MYPDIGNLTQVLLGFELPFPIHGFGLMVAVSVMLATTLTRLELDRKFALGLFQPVTFKDRDKNGKVQVEKGSPAMLVWVIMGITVTAGIIGAKVFHIIDYWDRFVEAPFRMLFSGSGLTFYGGLIFGLVALVWFLRHKKIAIRPFLDSVAPGVMLAYGVGRIGCYLAGDGDWGKCSSLAEKPAFMPGWLWSETFPRNIWNRDLLAECAVLGPGYTGVYPTMLYEFAAAALLAGLLWTLRKHPFHSGWLFALYLVFAGVERFSIEIIRVNPPLVFGLSQAQLISVALVVVGGVAMLRLQRRSKEISTVN
jgi:phosphatidylglycerol:prolipoprotein diacylglycerol transferase